MNHKSGKIASLVEPFAGRDFDAHYLSYFDCFNRQLFFEAHEVLEALWLPQRHGPDGNFYKGLIQLAGAFVHLQKERPGPAVALFKLAEKNLAAYPEHHHGLAVPNVLKFAARAREQLESSRLRANPLDASSPEGSQLELPRPAGANGA
jgi:predicted metal-dependent hydrolase